MRARAGALVASIASAVLGLATTPASAEPAGWDQQRAAELAVQLAAALRAVVTDPGLQQPQLTALQQRLHNAAVSDAKRVTEMADDLAARLEAGRGYYQTKPLFDGILLQREGIAEYAKNSWVPDPTREKIDTARELMRRLAVYYPDE